MTTIQPSPALSYDATESPRARNLRTWTESARLLYAGRIEEFLEFWTDDASYEAALPVPGLPAAISGKPALRAAFGGLAASTVSIRVEEVRFHQTDDPDVAIVEERMIAELADGWVYDNRLAIRVRFDDGRIAQMYEYYGQFAHAELLARLGFAG
jgi:ketosteroid isomerase-like protein